MSVYTLSEEAKAATTAAALMAQQKHHEELDTSHLFYILLTKSRAGSNWLLQANLTNTEEFLKELESSIAEWYPTYSEFAEPSGPYLKILRSAEKMVVESGGDVITPAHLLAAILENDQRIKEWLSKKILVSAQIRISPETPSLDQVGRDLTKLAREGKLPKVIGREKEVRQIEEVLLRQGKNSVLLIGPAGVGKTAIVERLAQDIIRGDVPKKLKKARLFELNLAALLAGTSFRGEFEKKMQDILSELEMDKSTVLVIDEFHALVGTGTTIQGGPDAVSILKPALARGDITCIGLTTNDDFTRSVENDSALVRRFHTINVSEPSPEDTLVILQQIAPQFEDHHHIDVKDEALKAIILWTQRFLPSRHFPDKAVDVFAKACARAEMQQQSTLTPELVAEILTEMTGIPVGDLDDRFRLLVANLENELSCRVIGQQEVISTFCQAIRLGYAGLRDARRPKGVYLFIGPSGVGKTELAKVLAETLFDSEKALIRLDMSEYSERINISRLIGSAPGYVGYDEPGQLTQALRERPHCVVLLDEIEKACTNVFDLLLQLFDEGRLTDAHGRLVDGRNAIFIMTSNLGVKSDSQSGLGFLKMAKNDQHETDNALRSFFRPEFINRVDHILYFRDLELDDMINICDLEIKKLVTRLEEQNIFLSYEKDILEIVVQKAANQGSGARGIKSAVENQIAIPLSNLLLQKKSAKKRQVHLLLINKEKIHMEWV